MNKKGFKDKMYTGLVHKDWVHCAIFQEAMGARIGTPVMESLERVCNLYSCLLSHADCSGLRGLIGAADAATSCPAL